MIAFRGLLALMLLVLGVYTGVVLFEYGPTLFQRFFGDMAAVNWAGQFNLDFMMMLMLSALWVSWRHEFSPLGLGLGVIAFFGGIGFLSVYLLIMIPRVNGDASTLLMGERANRQQI